MQPEHPIPQASISHRVYEVIIEILFGLFFLIQLHNEVANLQIWRWLPCRDMCEIVIWALIRYTDDILPVKEIPLWR